MIHAYMLHLLVHVVTHEIAHRSASERERMLSVIVVGGGPTGVEFAGELSDFIAKDLKKIDNGRAADMK